MRVRLECDPPTPEPGAFVIVTEDEGGYRHQFGTPRWQSMDVTGLATYLRVACLEHRRRAKRARKMTGVIGGPIAVVEIKRVPLERMDPALVPGYQPGKHEPLWSMPMGAAPEPFAWVERDKRRLRTDVLREQTVAPWEHGKVTA